MLQMSTQASPAERAAQTVAQLVVINNQLRAEYLSLSELARQTVDALQANVNRLAGALQESTDLLQLCEARICQLTAILDGYTHHGEGPHRN